MDRAGVARRGRTYGMRRSHAGLCAAQPRFGGCAEALTSSPYDRAEAMLGGHASLALDGSAQDTFERTDHVPQRRRLKGKRSCAEHRSHRCVRGVGRHVCATSLRRGSCSEPSSRALAGGPHAGEMIPGSSARALRSRPYGDLRQGNGGVTPPRQAGRLPTSRRGRRRSTTPSES